MQVQKTEIRTDILHAAKKEFLEFGFQNASMRRISQAAGVSTSNIYNYFKNKDDIFCAVTQPLTDSLDAGLAFIEKQDFCQYFAGREHITDEEEFQIVFEHIYTYRDEIRLVLFHASGSSLEDYKDEIVKRRTRIHHLHKKQIAEAQPDLPILKVSDFTVHNLFGFMVSIIGETILHDVTREDMYRHAQEIKRFMNGGWTALIFGNEDCHPPRSA